MLVKYFPNIMDVKFTAEMEDKLDDIEYDGKDWHKVLQEFYYDFDANVKNAIIESPPASPSKPSVIFTALLLATNINTRNIP